MFEHYGIRPKWMTQWRVKDLNAFGRSDPAAWRTSVGGAETAKAPTKGSWAPSGRMRRGPGGDHLFSFIAVGMFALWWVGILHFPGLMHVELLGADATVTAAPNWSTLFAPILVYA